MTELVHSEYRDFHRKLKLAQISLTLPGYPGFNANDLNFVKGLYIFRVRLVTISNGLVQKSLGFYIFNSTWVGDGL